MLRPRKPSSVPALPSKLRHVVPTRTSRRRSPRRTLPALGALGLGLALVALGAYSAVRPAAGQETFPEPSEFVSKDGVVQVQLTAAEQQIELAGTPVAARVYNGGVRRPDDAPGPGRHDRAGAGQLAARADQPPLPRPARFAIRRIRQCLTPRRGWGDRAVRVDLPADHAQGTFWYHSHQHGISEEQVFGGMSGLIVVEGLIDLLPEALQNIVERPFALKDFQLTADDAIVRDNIDSNAPTTRTVNGVVNPEPLHRAGRDPAVAVGQHRGRHLVRAEPGGARVPRRRRGRQPGLAGVVRRFPDPAARQAVRRAGPGASARDATFSGPWTSTRAVTTTRIPPWPPST